jgi:ppGpp synthetase/RelA/SpoT-type nucleotidyltranferase
MPPQLPGYDLAEIEKIIKEIQPYLIRRSQDWRRLQERIRSRINDYKSDPRLAAAIYQVYTREDRQAHLGVGHPHMKEFAKIAEEIYIARTGRTKNRAGKARSTSQKTDFQLSDVTDIIGITIVCPSEDDVRLIKNRIQEDITKSIFTSKKTKTHNEALYQAYHFIVGIDENPFANLCCEIQIRTAIQDAFSWKTHSLAYKGNGKTSPWDSMQFASVMEVLRAADTIVDSMAKKARDETDINNQKRRHARYLLSEKLARDLEALRSHQHFAFFQTAIPLLISQLPLPNPSRDGARVNEIRRIIDDIMSRPGAIANADKFFFRLIALCAIINPRQDSTFWLDDIFSRYIGYLETGSPRNTDERWNHITVFSLAHYCRGELNAACAVLERALTIPHCPPKVLAAIHCDLAYYYAEAFGQRGEARQKVQARQHESAARNILGSVIPPRHADSLGYVLIETSESICDIRRGLELCEGAIAMLLKGDTADEHTKKAGDYFLRLHREIAFRRIADMASADCDAALQSKPIS